MSYQIPGGVAIGGAVAGGTEGSVLFVGAGSVLAQDNANLFWDDTNNRLGIGYATPTFPLSLGQAGGDKIALYDGGVNSYGFGIGVNLLQIFSSGAGTGAVAIGTGPSSAFVETMRVTPTGVEIDGAKTLSFDAVVGDKITFAGTQTGFGLQPNTLQMFVSQPSVDKIALGFGSSGAFTEAFSIVSSSATPATGLRLTANAAGSGVTLTVFSSVSNENIILTPKGTGGVQFPDGAQGTPSIFGTNSANTGFYFTSASIAATTNGTLRWFCTNSAFFLYPANYILNFSRGGSGDVGLMGLAPNVLQVNGGTSATPGSVASPARTPAQITADQNNYAPGVGLFQRWSSDASRNITGLVAGTDGQLANVVNVGANNIVLVNESASSTAANRFTTNTGADITLASNEVAMLIYDNTSSRWRAAKL